MTGVKKLSSCVAAFLSCGSAVAAAPSGSFDAWTLTGETTITCPEGATCETGEGFYQRQITDDSGDDYFQTIVTDKTADSQTNVDHIKAVWVGQDMASLSDVAQEFGFTAYEDFTSTSGAISQFSLLSGADNAPVTWDSSTWAGSIDNACYSTPTGTDTSSGFIPTYGSQTSWFNAGSMVSIDIQTDFTPPTVTAPADTTTTVNGHANFFDLDPANGGQLPEVSDDQTESFDFSASNNIVVGPLPPGRHSITWQARDNAGNETSAEQQIDILPTVNFSVDQITTEGKSVTVTAYLNGPAPQYPVEIPFSVSGTATSGQLFMDFFDEPPEGDHDAVDGVITIENGTIGQTSFSVVSDNFFHGANEADETVIFTMGEPTNATAGQNTQHTVTITDTPQTLTLDFVIALDDQITPLVTTSDGVIRVSAIPRNQNNNWGAPTYDWSQSNNSLVSADCSQGSFYVDPSNLLPGLYRIHVNAAETNLPDQAASAGWWLRVGTAPSLNSSDDHDGDGEDDGNEGYHDDDNDGIPNYLDAINAAHLIPGYWKGGYKSLEGKIIQNQQQAYRGAIGWSVEGSKEYINYPMLIATEPGLKLGAGSAHLWRYEYTQRVAFDWAYFNNFASTFDAEPNFTVQFDEQGIPLIDNVAELDNLANLADPAFDPEDPVQNNGLHFMVSLEISFLAKAGASAKLVIPQATATHTSEGYDLAVRHYSPAFGWQNILEDHNNQVASALRDGDYCPPAGSSQYQTGLIDGFECLQLTLEDGSPNDADGYRNGRISFHGGVLPIMTNEAIPLEIAEVIIEPEIETDIQAQTAPQIGNDDKTGNSGGGGTISLLLLVTLLLAYRPRKPGLVRPV